MPFTLQAFAVRTFDIENWTMENVTITISGTDFRRTTGIDGLAKFSLPSGTVFSGFVFYDNKLISHFSSTDISTNTKELDLSLPLLSPRHEIDAALHGKIVFHLFFTDVNSTLLIGQNASFSYLGKTTDFIIGSSSTIITAEKNGTLDISLTKYDYTFHFIYNITLQNGTNSSFVQNGTNLFFVENETNFDFNTTISLYRLLNINTFQAVKESENCFSVIANISDPRTTIPLNVRMTKATVDAPTIYSEVQTTLNDAGLYNFPICIKSHTMMKIVASNRYESQEKSVQLTYVPPLPPQPPSKPADTTKDLYLSVCAVIVLISFILFYVYGRKNPAVILFIDECHDIFDLTLKEFREHVLRPVLEYLRLLRRALRGKGDL